MSSEVKTASAAELLNSLAELVPQQRPTIKSSLEDIGEWVQNSFQASAEDE